MMRHLSRRAYLSAFLLCTALGSCVSAPEASLHRELPPVPEITDRVLKQTVSFWSQPPQDNDPYPAAGAIPRSDGTVLGTGLHISPVHVLTAAHVAPADGHLPWEE